MRDGGGLFATAIEDHVLPASATAHQVERRVDGRVVRLGPHGLAACPLH
jgi:hypothetical protein